MKQTLFIAVALLALALQSCAKEEKEFKFEPTYLFGIEITPYIVDRSTVKDGESWSTILDRHGIAYRKVMRLEQLAKDIAPLNTIRAGKSYTTFTRNDSLGVKLDYVVYEKTPTDYVTFAFVGDSVSVSAGKRDVIIRRKKATATINSSLWGAIQGAKLPYALADELEDIYQWTIDFFSVQKGDAFTVIYDQKYIDTLPVGVGRIWGVKFTHKKRDIYAIPFKQNGQIRYWDKDGKSLRKQLLKAPLKFTRISSTYTSARLHPILKVYKAHYGVDYAAPLGTPVRSVADGVVTVRAYRGASGNMVRIKHPQNLESAYLHLHKFAKGIAVGSRVSQGQIIGYVGSTGRSTGPHLDFRLWKNGKPINPLKTPHQTGEPLAKAQRPAFKKICDRIVDELNGEVADSLKVTGKDFGEE